jgi:antirestriction protein ArdC
MSKYDEVTKQIAAQLKSGTKPWIKPFNGSGSFMPTRTTGQYYRGINVLLLWLQQRTAPMWMTYRQAAALGGQVRKGEKGTSICYSAPAQKKDSDETYQVMKWYSVFNCDQIDGLPDQYYPTVISFANPDNQLPSVNGFFSNTNAELKHGSKTGAFYMPSQDRIEMPDFDEFRSGLDYYSTLAHEHVHWTGHKSRLDRSMSPKKREYAFEELIAEMGAAFLMAHLGLEPSVRPDHTDYLSHWLEALGSDSKFIFQAASAASKAVDYMIDKQPAIQTWEAA